MNQEHIQRYQSNLPLAALVAAAIILAGCGAPTEPANQDSASAEDTQSALPASLLVGDETQFANAMGVVQAREHAEPGKSIALTGFVGGRVNPFVDNRAILTLADGKALTQCNLNPDDHCKTPWDTCCETAEQIKASVATIQVVDSNGAVLKRGLNGFGGLHAGGTITVQGEVATGSIADALIVNAKKIHVQP